MNDHDNSLNTREQQLLRELERDLQRDDPVFAELFSMSRLARIRARLSRGRRAVVFGTSLFVGVVGLAIGIGVGSPLTGLVGFAAVLATMHAWLPDDGLFHTLRSAIRSVAQLSAASWSADEDGRST
jgi:hypothetical protein